MGFLGVYTAIYDYAPHQPGELAIQEGDLLFVLEKDTDDDWWKAKKRASSPDEEEPTGLIPNNYIEEAKPSHQAKALYDYARQTDEELSFSEDASLDVYDTSDEDWTLVGLNGEYGFVPANYIELLESSSTIPRSQTAAARTSSHEGEVESLKAPSSPVSPTQSPAATLAGIIQQKQSTSSRSQRDLPSPASPPVLPPERPILTPDASDDEPAPVLPQRPVSQEVSPPPRKASPKIQRTSGVVASPPYNRVSHRDLDDEIPPTHASPGGFHLYNIHEVVSVMGKQKKVPTTLGLNIATGNITIAPAKSRDGEQQEWTAEKLTHYSIEGKRIFMELVRPAKSVDFHAGAKDTAQEIVGALGEMAGAVRAEGLKEVLAASSGGGQKMGRMLYDFVAQSDDEVTVAVDDEVIIVDDTKSDEWWMIRRLKNGKEGVVPSQYIEITGAASAPSTSTSGINAGRSNVQQNRLEEERLAREASRSTRDRSGSITKASEVGPGVRLPERGSSLMSRDNSNGDALQRNKRESKSDPRSPNTSKPKPDTAKIRTWTDRTASFKVEAEFIGCKDGKIHLHKLNGVKIAVPVAKMSPADLEYVETVTGQSLDEDKPLSDIRKQRLQPSSKSSSQQNVGATIETKKDDSYWFDFFLQCGVGPHLCQRYAQTFIRDSMDESVLPDITSSNLRTLGLKEGDILRVMKNLDTRFGRTANRTKRNVSFGGAEVMGDGDEAEATNGSLFSGPGGALRNNTRKGRPAPAVQTNDVVDPKAFQREDRSPSSKKPHLDGGTPMPLTNVPTSKKSGFDDDAWDVKPSKQQTAEARKASSPPPAASAQQPLPQPPLSGAMNDLSLLDMPLQPTIAHATGTQPAQSHPPAPVQSPPTSQTQTTVSQPPQSGANPGFFSQINQQNPSQPQPPSINTFVPQQTGFNQPPSTQQNAPPRQRPQVPQIMQGQASLMPPPPPRPFSAPQNASQPNGFGPPPLQPQLTGYQNPTNYQPSIAPPGQSLNNLGQMRLEQQYQQQQQLQPQITGYMQQSSGLAPQATGFGQFGNQINPQPSAFAHQQPPQQNNFPSNSQFLGPQSAGSPFASPAQPGSFQSIAPQPTGYQQPQPTGINSMLPPALQPQPTGPVSFQQNFGQPQIPPVPPMPPMTQMPQQPAATPLVPQKTGPPPPVRFGVPGGAQKLISQPTGKRANLAQATPDNPFGF